ncbi:hypothetical protein BJX64DRAFT_265350 [Aspergillus heterothallicus]
MVLGAAIGGAAPNNPSWSAGYDAWSAGGVLEAMLRPLGGFGKFVSVLLSFSLLGNLAAAMYSISINFSLLIPSPRSSFIAQIPRFVYVIVYTGVAIPVAISAADSFFASLENFLYLIAYWSAAFVGVILTEQFVFRRANWAEYNDNNRDENACLTPSLLPTGIAAVVAIGLSFGLVVPCMAQIWYTGPLAETVRDLGFEVALVLAPVLYLPCRWGERRVRGC